jgi:hypothetical protein
MGMGWGQAQLAPIYYNAQEIRERYSDRYRLLWFGGYFWESSFEVARTSQDHFSQNEDAQEMFL